MQIRFSGVGIQNVDEFLCNNTYANNDLIGLCKSFWTSKSTDHKSVSLFYWYRIVATLPVLPTYNNFIFEFGNLRKVFRLYFVKSGRISNMKNQKYNFGQPQKQNLEKLATLDSLLLLFSIDWDFAQTLHSENSFL